MARTYYKGEVAKLLGMSRRHLQRLLNTGTIPEPKLRSSYGHRQWAVADVQRARKALAAQRAATQKKTSGTAFISVGGTSTRFSGAKPAAVHPAENARFWPKRKKK